MYMHIYIYRRIFVCVCADSMVCMCLYCGMYVEVRGKLKVVSSLFPSCGSMESNSSFGLGENILLTCWDTAGSFYFETGRLCTWASLGWFSWVAEIIDLGHQVPLKLFQFFTAWTRARRNNYEQMVQITWSQVQ